MRYCRCGAPIPSPVDALRHAADQLEQAKASLDPDEKLRCINEARELAAHVVSSIDSAMDPIEIIGRSIHLQRFRL